MKWYENLAAGVVSLVPTPRFLREIVEKHKDLNFVNILPTFDIGEDWFKYIEFYGDDLGEYFYKFDSLDDLKRILAQDVIDVDNVRDRAPVMWEKVRMEAIETWKDILFL